MIKNNPLGLVLVTGILFCSLISCGCFARWFYAVRELQGLEYRLQRMNAISTAVHSLANEALEYSRRNPAIDPILQQFELKPRQATTQPATRPTAK
jgi:hypothetical protein